MQKTISIELNDKMWSHKGPVKLMVNKCKGMFLYGAVSSPLDHSKRFARHHLADLFLPTPTGLIGEAFSNGTITGSWYRSRNWNGIALIGIGIELQKWNWSRYGRLWKELVQEHHTKWEGSWQTIRPTYFHYFPHQLDMIKTRSKQCHIYIDKCLISTV